MDTKRTVARNVFANCIGLVVQMLAGFVVAPFLVHRLGDTRYGLWILIASLTGYFSLLDFGVCGSVGRSIAFHRARGDRDGLNAVMSTALAFLCGVAVVVMLMTLVVAWVFFRLFDVPAEDAHSVRLAVMIVGLNLAITFPLYVFDATLWAMQRFDLINAIDIPVVGLRAGLTFLLVGQGQGLVALALITVLVTAVGATAKVIMAYRLDPDLKISPRFVRRDAAHSLLGYGVWYFLLSLARLITPQVSPVVIGAQLGPRLVTPLSVAARLTGYGNSILWAGTQVLTPVVTRLHAQESHDKQQIVFLEGGRWCASAVLFFVGLFVCVGGPFLNLWMGSSIAQTAYPLLVIISLGELLPMSQWVTYSLILGTGRHRELAFFFLLETVVVVCLALALARPYGLIGVCVAAAIPGTLFRGICQMIYACRIVGVPVTRYVNYVFVPAAAIAFIPATCLALLAAWHEPATWLELLAYGAVYGVMFCGMAICILIGPERARLLATEFGLLPARS